MTTIQIKHTYKNSSELGNCELCGKYCSDVYIGTIYEAISEDDGGGRSFIGSFFGHKECLESNHPLGGEKKEV